MVWDYCWECPLYGDYMMLFMSELLVDLVIARFIDIHFLFSFFMNQFLL